MDKEKLNAKITVVVDQGNANAAIEGNVVAIIMGFKSLAVCIMDSLVNDAKGNLEEVSEALKDVVDFAVMQVGTKDFIKNK